MSRLHDGDIQDDNVTSTDSGSYDNGAPEASSCRTTVPSGSRPSAAAVGWTSPCRCRPPASTGEKRPALNGLATGAATKVLCSDTALLSRRSGSARASTTLLAVEPGSAGSSAIKFSSSVIREAPIPHSKAPYPDYGRATVSDADQFPSHPRPHYVGHRCSVQCKFRETPNALAEYTKTVSNPLILPLWFGWFREVNTQIYGRSAVPQERIRYYAPCGRLLRTMAKLQEYLILTDSILPITLFSLDVDIDIYRKFSITDKSYVKYFNEDLAKKILNSPYVRIPVVNCFSQEKPSAFSYIKKNSRSEGATRKMEHLKIEDRVVGCSCSGHCDKDCLCVQLMADGGEALKHGRLASKQRFVVECNSSCSCGPTCGNRTTTSAIPFPMIMYYYPDKGYGVRALCDIPSGSFIAFYSGQIITEEESQDGLRGDKYLVALDFALNDPSESSHPSGKDEQVGFLVDGRKFGNFSRFFNHSCEPNMFVQVVHRETFSSLIYNVAFFTSSHIKAGDELTWNYGYVIGSVPDRAIECLCRASTCKIRML